MYIDYKMLYPYSKCMERILYRSLPVVPWYSEKVEQCLRCCCSTHTCVRLYDVIHVISTAKPRPHLHGFARTVAGTCTSVLRATWQVSTRRSQRAQNNPCRCYIYIKLKSTKFISMRPAVPHHHVSIPKQFCLCHVKGNYIS